MRRDGEFANDWVATTAQHLAAQNGNWPILYWVRWDMAANGAAYKRHAYGTLLLGLNPEGGQVPVRRPVRVEQAGRAVLLGLGRTGLVEHHPMDSLRVAGTNLYRREFAHGSVIVNNSSSPATFRPRSTRWDVNRLVGGRPTAVSSVTIPGYDAAFLLK